MPNRGDELTFPTDGDQTFKGTFIGFLEDQEASDFNQLESDKAATNDIVRLVQQNAARAMAGLNARTDALFDSLRVRFGGLERTSDELTLQVRHLEGKRALVQMSAESSRRARGRFLGWS